MDTIKKRILLTPLNILYRISPKMELKLLFRIKQGYKLNLKNPKTFNEKIQWIKLNDRNKLMPKCVDKYAVREYVENKGCGEILNELLWSGFNPEDIPYDILPNKFVIKVTHGSTFNVICTNKSKLNIEETTKQLNKWLKEKFLPCYGEWFYGIEKPRIIIERFIESKCGLKDFKVFCFNGMPQYIGVYSDRQTSGKPNQEIYSIDWNLIDEHTNAYENPSTLTKKPTEYYKLLLYAQKLSENFKHARVDFFIEDDKIYFGEITFTSSAGFGKFSSKKFELEMGSYLKLEGENMNKKKVLMIGPARSVKGGMTTVIDNYYYAGLDKKIDLKYIETINDKNKILKLFAEIKGKIKFIFNIKKYNIVHIHVASRRSTFRKAWYVKIAKKYNKKIILHMHGGGYKNFYSECSAKQQEYIKEILALCDKVIVLSEEWFEYFKELVNPDKIEIIYNSIILPKDFKKNVNSNSFLFLGRIGERKGIFDLIDVFAELIKVYPKIKLYIGGEGEVEKLKKTISEKKLSDSVEYIGWTKGDKKDTYLKESSFFILPSYKEGMPMSVLEGMAYKNVTVSTNVGGIPKVIINEKNGIIFNPGDKEKLYYYLDKLLSDENKRKELSANARLTIEEKFDVLNMIENLIQVYNEL